MSSIWTIRRSATDSKVTGLCGGLAQHWGVDPVLVRVGCALLALSGGIGIVLYLAGWLLVPLEGVHKALIHDLLGEQARGWSREVWIIIVAVCCIVVFAMIQSVTPFGFGPAVILALIWYFGYYKHRPPPRDEPVGAIQTVDAQSSPVEPPQFLGYPGPPTPFTEAADAWRQRIEEAQRSAGSPVADYDAFLAVPDPVGLYAAPDIAAAPVATLTPNRSVTPPAKRLRLLSLVVVGLTLSALGAADALGVEIAVASYFAATLLVLGLTLVAAAWCGRARGILPVAVVVLLGTLATTIGGPVAHDRGWGTETVRYTTASQLIPGDTHELGELKVDLTGLTTKTDATYAAHVAVGSLDVTAPRSMNVVINWRVKSGALILDGRQQQGNAKQAGTVRPATLDPKKKTLTLDLSTDRGLVQVQR